MHLSRLIPGGMAARHVDRRRWPRIDVRDRIRSTLAESDEPVRLLDLSFDGCLIATARRLPIGSLHQVTLATVDRAVSVTVTVRVVHSRQARGSVFAAGCQFIAPRTSETAADFDRLMDAATDVLSYDIACLKDEA